MYGQLTTPAAKPCPRNYHGSKDMMTTLSLDQTRGRVRVTSCQDARRQANTFKSRKYTTLTRWLGTIENGVEQGGAQVVT